MPIVETTYEVHRWSRKRFVRALWNIGTPLEAELHVADMLKRNPEQQLRIVRRTERVILVTRKVPA